MASGVVIYCEKCRRQQSWPKRLSLTVGTCNVCGLETGCHWAMAVSLKYRKSTWERLLELDSVSNPKV